MSQKNLIAKIKDDEWFLSLIERRLKENKESMDERERFMNEIALISSIDFRLKYLNSMASDSRKEMIQNILEVCKKNGFIPQYESSGSPSFNRHGVKLSPDGIFAVCFSDDGIVIFPSRELPLCWTKLTLGKEFGSVNPSSGDVSFSPDSSKIAFLYANILHIWDVSELKVQRLENMDFFTTVNTISWSADSKRIAYVKQEGEICVYDIHENRIVQSISISDTFSATCLDDQGMNILLLGDSAIRIIDVVSGEEISQMSSPVMFNDAEVLFKDEEFYVLTNGAILKIKDEIEIINPDGIIFPLSRKFEKLYNSSMFDFLFASSYGLELKNENLIMHDQTINCNEVDYILSDTLDIKMIQHRQSNSGLSTADKIEASKFLDKAEKKYIPYELAKIADKNGQTVYLAGDGQIIGFEKVEENDKYIKFNFRKYIFSNPLGNLWDGLVIPTEFMKSYEKIFSGNWDGEFQDDLRISHRPPSAGKKAYFRQTGTEVMIKDSSVFRLIDFSVLRNWRGFQKKAITKDKNVYI